MKLIRQRLFTIGFLLTIPILLFGREIGEELLPSGCHLVKIPNSNSKTEKSKEMFFKEYLRGNGKKDKILFYSNAKGIPFFGVYDDETKKNLFSQQLLERPGELLDMSGVYDFEKNNKKKFILSETFNYETRGRLRVFGWTGNKFVEYLTPFICEKTPLVNIVDGKSIGQKIISVQNSSSPPDFYGFESGKFILINSQFNNIYQVGVNIKMGPEFPSPENHLEFILKCLINLGQFSQCISKAKEILAKETLSPMGLEMVHSDIAFADMELGDETSAMEEFSKAAQSIVQTYPLSDQESLVPAKTNELLGDYYLRKGQYSSADACYVKAISSFQTAETAWENYLQKNNPNFVQKFPRYGGEIKTLQERHEILNSLLTNGSSN